MGRSIIRPTSITEEKIIMDERNKFKLDELILGEELLPKVSVIVPIYNTKLYLEKCLGSIKNQTYENIDVLMIDDGSTDGSAKLALEYEKNDKRFVYFYQENAGVSVARNKGLELATGEYVLFIDSDDWLELDMIEILVNNIVAKRADVSCCQYDHCPPHDIDILEVWEREKVITEFLIHRKINGSLVNKLFKRNIIGETVLDKNIKYGEDALFLWKVIKNGVRLVITNNILYHVSLHNDSASGGGFKPSRMDCIKVWDEIVNDTRHNYPKMIREACARRGHMAFYAWYEMVISDRSNMEFEKVLYNALKQDLSSMIKSKNILAKVKAFACIVVVKASFAKKMLVGIQGN